MIRFASSTNQAAWKQVFRAAFLLLSDKMSFHFFELQKIPGVTNVAKNALRMDIPVADIVKMTGLTIEEVERLRN